MTDEKVCGYANHETFTIHMDIHNNNGLKYKQCCLKMAANRVAEDMGFGNADIELAGDLRSHYEHRWERELNLDNQVFDDLMSASLERVDWLEIAKELIQELTNG